MFSSHIIPMSQMPSTSRPYTGGSVGHGDNENFEGGTRTEGISPRLWFLVEDDAGRIEAIQYIDDEDSSPPQVVPNTVVKIIGTPTNKFTHHQNSFLFTPPLNPDAQKVLICIMKCSLEIGISRNELSENFRTSMSDLKINENLEFLIVEGLIYSTVNQFHFRSTDA